MDFSYGVTDGKVALPAATRQTFDSSVEQQIRAKAIENQAQADGVRTAAGFLYDLARDTTTVALTSYQFFTGATPTAAGLDYLVSSAANPNDLNDPYYAAFNLENRYINFAVNLGVVGEGAAAFKAAYGALSFAQTADLVYDKVIGKQVATDAGYDVAAAIADIAGRQSYFEAVAQERAAGLDPGLATRAGLVGYIIAEAIKAELGVYARSAANFYLDLTDGSAQYNVNLVGAYGPGTTLDVV
jgi:serralysin